jgi:aryl-alcohol dehydrogenase-like predicted oxidoreductase
VERFDRREALEVIRHAFESGINFFDTADVYAQGNSEKLLAEALGKQRDEIVLASKGGYRLSNIASAGSRLKPVVRRVLRVIPRLASRVQAARSSQMRQDFSRSYLINALEQSLRRLQTDRIDLYQLHSPPPEVLADGTVFETLESMRDAGKILGYGVSCVEPDHARMCLEVPNLTSVQIEANVLKPENLGRLSDFQRAGVSIIARQPFASGLLTRDPLDWTIDDFGGDAEALRMARKRAERVSAFGPEPQIALRYVAHHPAITSVLMATTRTAHLEENLRAMSAPPLSESEIARIEEPLSAY